MYPFFRSLLFLFRPDYVHERIVKLGKRIVKIPGAKTLLRSLFSYNHSSLEREVLGIRFKNPVGLAGGFDKNAELIGTIPYVGFGFMEVGSITRHPYGGNRRPWSVRLKKDRSIIVNYGLKNEGADVIAKRMERAEKKIPLIVNIAKTNDASISGRGTVEDYLYSYRKLEPLADIVNINISCPNTGDGMLLCDDLALLENFLIALQSAYEVSAHKKPIVLKLKPDMDLAHLEKLIMLVKKFPCIKGFVVSNLSKNRSLLKSTPAREHEPFAGGISGKPVQNISTEMIRSVRRLAGEEYAIIGVGGIFSAADAKEKFDAGADLIELMTGMIYEGPGVVKRINKGLAISQ
jgi:dihydroorotate dehydrogenase